MLLIENAYIKAIASSVPSSKVSNDSLSSTYGDKEVTKLINSIGVFERRVSDYESTTADLCFDAALNIFDNNVVSRKDVDAVIFISQTSEYQLPSTACILQNKLGLSKTTLAFDINMGCSGYVYGVYVASSLVNSGCNNVLLLVGDTITKLVKPGDRSTELLFGDCGTASIISKKQHSKLFFDLGTDGSGYKSIIANKLIEHNSNDRASNYSFLEMNGAEVFTFTLKTIPELVDNFLKDLSLHPIDINNCFYHQANHFMLKHLLKKSNFSSTQVPISLDEYGNTSGASIPLTICSRPRDNYQNSLLIGFGVGLSWGVALCDLSNTIILPVRDYRNI